VTPWTVRNYRVSKAFIPVQTLTWYNFWLDLDYRVGKPWPTSEQLHFPGVSSAELFAYVSVPRLSAVQEEGIENRLGSAAVSWVRSHPLQFVRKTVDNVFTFWYSVDTWQKNAVVLAVLALELPFLVVAIIAGRSGPRRMLMLLCIGMVAYLDLVYAPVFAYARYSTTALPFVSILVAVGVVAVAMRSGSRAPAGAEAPVGAADQGPAV
jgi:hypothetical protein